MSQFVNNPDHEFQFDTLALHVGQEEADPASDSRAVPIYQTTSYVFRNSQHAADRRSRNQCEYDIHAQRGEREQHRDRNQHRVR